MRRLSLLLAAIFFLLSNIAAFAVTTCTSCFWVGGTGTLALDGSTDAAHWALSSNGTGNCGNGSGACTPTSGATLTFDNNSGGGTVTVNVNGTVNSIVMGAFTGTLTFATNNNSWTLSGGAAAFSVTGSGTRTLNLGTGTFTLSGATAGFDATTTTGLTCTCSSATIAYTGSVGVKALKTGGQTFGTVTFSSGNKSSLNITGTTPTIATLNITAPAKVILQGSTTLNVTNAPTWTGSSGNEIGLVSSIGGTAATLRIHSGTAVTMTWMGISDITADTTDSTTYTANNSFDLSDNTNFTINAPSGGTSNGTGIIGGGF